MFLLLGQTPNYTDGLTPTDTSRGVFWRGFWHRFAGGDETPPPTETPPVTPPVVPPVTPPAADPPAKPFDDAYVRDLRKENATYRKAAEEAQARLKEIDDASKSDLEKATARADALAAQLATTQAQHRDALIRAAVEREAHAAGAVKADVVWRLIDRAGIEIGDDGEVTGADKAVKTLLDAEPYLKAGTAGTTAVPATPRATGAATKPNDVATEYLRRTYGPRPTAAT